MSRIDSLTIKGIRSYSCDKSTSINFDETLTLILGVNGSGKTTLLECLKYVCTGNLPCGSKMANFVSDLKILNKKEIKSKIELRFTDLNNVQCLAQRSILTVLKNEKIETKLLQANLIIEDDHGHSRNIACRAGDTVQHIALLLGASPAIIEYVILCHHEDACWPIGEPKVLKDRFDEIFATTNYNKALESVRLDRKLKAQTLKDSHQELNQLNSIFQKSIEIKSRYHESKTKYKSIRCQIENFKASLIPKNQEIVQYSSKLDALTELNKKINSIMCLEDHISAQVCNLRTILPNKDLTLSYTLKQIDDKQKILISLEQELLINDNTHVHLLNDSNEVRNLIERENINHVLFSGRIDDLKSRITRGYELIDNKFDACIPDIFEYGEKFKSSLNLYYGTMNQLLRNQNVENVALKKKLDDTKRYFESDFETYRNEEAIFNSKKHEIKRLINLLQETNTKISNINTLKSKLDETVCYIIEYTNNLTNFKKEIEIIEKSYGENLKKHEILTVEIKEAEYLLNDMQNQHSLASEYERLCEQKDKLTSELRKILYDHECILNQFTVDVNTLTPDLWKKIISQIEIDLSKYTSLINDIQKSISLNEILINNSLKNINEKTVKTNEIENEMSKVQKDISNIYHGDLNVSFSEVISIIDRHQIKKLKSQTLEHFYHKFVRKLKRVTSDEQSLKCPLCVQHIVPTEITGLIDKLGSKISRFLVKIAKSEESIKAYETLKTQLSSIAELTDMNINYHNQLSKYRSEIEEENSCVKINKDKFDELQSTLEENMKQKENVNCAIYDLYMGQRMIVELLNIRDSCANMLSTKTSQDLSLKIEECQSSLSQKKLEKTNLEKLNNKYQKELNEINNNSSKLNQMLNSLYQKKAEYLIQISLKNESEKQRDVLLQQELDLNCEIEQISQKLDAKKIKNMQAHATIDGLDLQYNNSVSEYNKNISTFEFKQQQIHETVIKFINDFNDEECVKKLDQCTLLRRQLEDKKSALESQLYAIKAERIDISNKITALNIDISNLKSYLELFKKEEELEKIKKDIKDIQIQIDEYEPFELLKNNHDKLNSELNDINNQISHLNGICMSLKEHKKELKKDLTSSLYKDSETNYQNKTIQINVLSKAIQDLDDYYAALDYAITKYHSIKIKQINDIIYEYWSSTYKGEDISTIEIRSEVDEENNKFKEKRCFNYKILMLKDDVEIDMRGRCSSGQKMMASIIIRLALAEAFCGSCSFLALDEPTTNLDSNNIQGLADCLRNLVMKKKRFGQFQLILITHDEKFLTEMCHDQLTNHYYEIYKDDNGFSSIKKCPVGTFIG